MHRSLALLVCLVAGLHAQVIGPITGGDTTSGVPQSRVINTAPPLSGGGNLGSDLVLAIQPATNVDNGYLSAADHVKLSTALQLTDVGVILQAYSANTTIAGNAFNGISQLVQTTAAGRLPALDGSLLTGLTASQIPALDASKITTGTFTYQRVGTGGDGTGTHYLTDNGAFQSIVGSAGGTVTSVNLTLPSWLTYAGGAITTSGTFNVTATTGLAANSFLATPNASTGALAVRAMVVGDIPANLVTYAKIQQVAAAKLLGNPTGSTSNAVEIGLDGGLSFSGSTLRGFKAAQSLAAYAVDASTGKSFFKTLIAGTNTFTWSNFNDGDSIVVRCKQVASGSVGTVAFPANGADGVHTTYWQGGSQPTQTATFSKSDFYEAHNQGGDVYVFASQNY